MPRKRTPKNQAPKLAKCETCQTAILPRDRTYRGAETTLCKRCGERQDRDLLRGHYIKIAFGPNRAERRFLARHPQQARKRPAIVLPVRPRWHVPGLAA